MFLVSVFIGNFGLGFLGFGLRVLENRPILDLYSFKEQHILVLNVTHLFYRCEE